MSHYTKTSIIITCINKREDEGCRGLDEIINKMTKVIIFCDKSAVK